MITSLEKGMHEPWRLYPSSSPGSFNIVGGMQTYGLTSDGATPPTYGQKPYTIDIVDNYYTMSTDGNPVRLTEKDYQINSLSFDGYFLYRLTDPTNFNSWMGAGAMYTAEQYKPHALYIQKSIDTAGDGTVGTNWEKLGDITRFGDTYQNMRFTYVDGRVIDNPKTSAQNRLKIELPTGTVGFRLNIPGDPDLFRIGNNGIYVDTQLKKSDTIIKHIKNNDRRVITNLVSAYGNAEGVMEKVSGRKTAFHYITRSVVTSFNAKGHSKPVRDDSIGGYRAHYYTTQYESISWPNTNVAQAIAESGLMEQKEATFYDSLPPGVKVDTQSIVVRKATLWGADAIYPHVLSMVDNWAGTGRTMMIVKALVPDGVSNYFSSPSGGSLRLVSGMRLDYDMTNTWANVDANGPVLKNYVAYEAGSGNLQSGVADDATGVLDANKTPVVPPDLLHAFYDLDGDGNEDPTKKNFMYVNDTLIYSDILSTQKGFTKQVAGAGDPAYSDHTTVPLKGGYSYLLQEVNESDVQVKDIIIYDVLEEAHEGVPHWQGTFLGLGTQQLEKLGIQVIPYYSTIPGLVLYDAADQAGAAARRDITNANIWSITPPADLSELTAIAVDLRKMHNGEDFILPESGILSLYIYMEAPLEDASGLVENNILAYNRNIMASSVKPAGQDHFSDIAVEAGNRVTVALKEPGIDLVKDSLPVSGSEEYPTAVQATKPILYRLHLKNTNLADAIHDITLEDAIPDGLTIEFDKIALMRMDNISTRELIADSDFASVTQPESGQLLTFTIPRLLAGEKVTFEVPTTVDSLENPLEVKDYINTTKITRIYDTPYEKESPPTWHKLWPAVVELGGTKTLLNRPFLPGETYTFELRAGSDGTGTLVRTAQAVAPDTGEMPAALDFLFAAIGFDREGVYRFTVQEAAGNGDSIQYDTSLYGVTISVTMQGDRLVAAVVYTKDGAQAPAPAFENKYLATEFTQRKEWLGEPEPRPPITLQLYRDGRAYGLPVELPLDDGAAMWTTDSWSYTWTGLPQLKADGSGVPSVYTAEEIAPPPHYQGWMEGGVIYNMHRPGSFSARKVWVPADQPGEPVTLNLYRTILHDESPEPYRELVDTVTLIGEPQLDTTINGEHLPWVYTWLDLPANGPVEWNNETLYASFEYEVEEDFVPMGYNIDTTASASWKVTNFLTSTEHTLTKGWVGGRERPAAQFLLRRDGRPYNTISLPLQNDDPMWATDTWTYTWTHLPKYAETAKVLDVETGLMVWDFANRDAWVESVYTVEEVPVPGYEIIQDGFNITNAYLAAIGDYVWYDSNNNGIQDPDEKPVPGVRVTIAGADGTALPQGYDPERTTDANGLYLFEQLPPGNYVITFDASTFPTDYMITITNAAGATEENDSNGLTSRVTLEREDVLTIDLGLVYAPPPTPAPAPDYPAISVPIPARKALSGRALKEGEFTFILKDAAGNIVDRRTNAADGTIAFQSRRMSRTGTFLYTVVEERGADKTMTYDSAVYRLSARVWAEGGTLKHSVSAQKDGVAHDGPIVFTNQYALPPTGDTGLRLPLMLAALALIVLSFVWTRRRRHT